MTPQEQLDAAIREVRRHHRDLEPQPRLRAQVRASARSAVLRQRTFRALVWTFAIAAIAAFVTFQLPRPGRPETAFVAVPGSEGLPEPAEKIVVRIQLPRSAVGSYGPSLVPPPGTGPVTMEFILGGDGLARAVRFAI